MTESDPSEAQIQRRISPRANVMLAASIVVDGRPANIRIRNISKTGALLEGSVVPAVGTELILKRLNLQVPGKVVWVSGGRCGVAFDGEVVPKEWIGSPISWPPSSPGQDRVDAIQAAVRAGAPVEPAVQRADSSASAAATDRQLDDRIAEEVHYVRRLLETMADELSAEPVFLASKAQLLQQFDLAGQVLGHLAAVLTADDRVQAVERIGREDLRGRLLRKSIAKPLGGERAERPG